MKLVTFSHGGRTAIGAIVAPDRRAILDLNCADPRLPTDMIAFLAAGPAAQEVARALVAAPDARYLVPEDEVKLLAPVPRPGKILGLSAMYGDPARPGAPRPQYPVVFGKFASTVIGNGEPIVIPRVSNEVDYEAELGVVIGRLARRVAEADALSYVAGYLAVNDVTARDWARHSSHWTAGKNFDTFGPLGPVLVTADEIPDPHHLELVLRLNGEELQHANTGDMNFSIPWLIAYLSTAMTLEPGDIISTGTPAGTGASRTPQVFLKPGDEVSVTIEKIGELRNPVVAES